MEAYKTDQIRLPQLSKTKIKVQYDRFDLKAY